VRALEQALLERSAELAAAAAPVIELAVARLTEHIGAAQTEVRAGGTAP
jgi:hypothetical protein